MTISFWLAGFWPHILVAHAPPSGVNWTLAPWLPASELKCSFETQHCDPKWKQAGVSLSSSFTFAFHCRFRNLNIYYITVGTFRMGEVQIKNLLRKCTCGFEWAIVNYERFCVYQNVEMLEWSSFDVWGLRHNHLTVRVLSFVKSSDRAFVASKAFRGTLISLHIRIVFIYVCQMLHHFIANCSLKRLLPADFYLYTSTENSIYKSFMRSSYRFVSTQS